MSWKHVYSNESINKVIVRFNLFFSQADPKNRGYFACNQKTIDNAELLPNKLENHVPRVLGDYVLTSKAYNISKKFNGLYCKSFSETENWMSSQAFIDVFANLKHAMPPTVFNISYSDSKWIENLNNAKTWNLLTRVNLQTNNTSPVTFMFPTIRIPISCPTEIQIPVIDEDNDDIQCRWSKDSECNNNCELPNNVTLDENKCLLKFNLTSKIGIYVIRLQVEDYRDNQRLSSVPLEFTVEAFSNPICSIIDRPVFKPPTPENNICIPLKINQTFHEIVAVESKNSYVKEINVEAPPGLEKSELYQCKNKSTIRMNMTWIPKNEELNMICLKAINTLNVSSEVRCMTLAVGYEPPKLLYKTKFRYIFTNTTEWTFEANMQIIKGVSDTFIRFSTTNSSKDSFYNTTDFNIINGRRLEFRTRENLFDDNKDYYIFLDSGLVRSKLGCQPANDCCHVKFSVKNCNFSCGYGKCTGVNECKCEAGWTGYNCSTPICKKECKNAGTCTAPDTCTCTNQWNGQNCETPICTKPCQNNGICSGPDNCTCTNQWNGPNCELPICSKSCLNGGSCSGPDSCTCTNQWNGTNCDRPICSKLCANGGTCSVPDTCTCTNQWNGHNCETPICTHACLNGGSCSAPDSCRCTNQWNGTYCDRPICSKLCANGGTCSAPDTCTCTNQWNGHNCETPICTHACKNGKCSAPDTCTCTKQWIGKNCETPICTNFCQNNGTCSAPDHCTCISGRTGKFCEILLADC